MGSSDKCWARVLDDMQLEHELEMGSRTEELVKKLLLRKGYVECLGLAQKIRTYNVTTA